jgi:sporulation protein YlmC with PRC-barrel domain
VIVNQPQDQPNVRIERMDEAQQRQATNQGQQANQQAQQKRDLTDEERQNARTRLGVDDPESTGSTDAQNVSMRAVAISDLDAMDVYNARGEKLGDVDRVIADGNNRNFVVVAHGGFLGIGEDQVAFPIERFWMRGDRLVIRGVTDDDIEAMDDYRDAVQNYQRVSDNDQAELRVWQ